MISKLSLIRGFGVSSVSTGSVNNEGLVSDMTMYGIDIVTNPSSPGAYPNSLYESLDSTKGYKILTLAETVLEDKDAQKYLVKELKKFFESFK